MTIFEKWKSECGIILMTDDFFGKPTIDNGNGPYPDSRFREDAWKAPDWGVMLDNSTGNNVITINDFVIVVTFREFSSAKLFARAVQRGSNGSLVLDRTFLECDWKKIWCGYSNGDRQGITRGLREYLDNKISKKGGL